MKFMVIELTTEQKAALRILLNKVELDGAVICQPYEQWGEEMNLRCKVVTKEQAKCIRKALKKGGGDEFPKTG